jgi:hypothetical protein
MLVGGFCVWDPAFPFVVFDEKRVRILAGAMWEVWGGGQDARGK